MASTLDAYLVDALNSVRNLSAGERLHRRYDKFRAMGEVRQASL
jgi:acetyl-CoA carboxylase alpha subunit